MELKPGGAGWQLKPQTTTAAANVSGAGVPYRGLPSNTNIRQGAAGFPDWVYQLGSVFGIDASTYAGHQTRNGSNTGIDWWPAGVSDMSGKSYTEEQAARLDQFAEWLGTQQGVGQVIWENPFTGNKVGFAGGRRVGPGTDQPQYYADDWIDHRGHVHSQHNTAPGGVLPSGMPLANGQTTNTLLGNISNNTAALANTQYGLPAQLEALAAQDELLRQGVSIARGQKTDDASAIAALQHIDTLIADQNALNTPAGKDQAAKLGEIRNGIMARQGLTEGPDTLGAASDLASQAVGIAGAGFAVADSVLNSIAATKEITGTLVRGISNTEDIYKIVDQIQEYIQLAVDVGSLVSSILGIAGGAAGMGAAGDTSGGAAAAAAALSAASSIAGIITSVISAVNAWIDVGQEVYKIGTKYMGRMLLNLFNLPGASDVNYLLDTVTKQLKVYSADNPEFKTTLNTFGRAIGGSYGDRTGPQNTFYIYQGPGQDPADTMNDAMFAVRSSGVGVFGYGANA